VRATSVEAAMRTSPLACSVLVPFLLLAACGDDAPALPDAAPAPAADAALTLPDARADAALPDTPARTQLTWVLAALNGAPVTPADAAAHFTSAFLAQVPATQLAAIFAQLAALGPWAHVGFDGEPLPARLVAAVTRGDGQYWRIALATSSAEGDRIGGLLLAAAGDLDPALASFDAIDGALAQAAPRVNLLAASVAAGACTPLHELHPEASLAIGSTFKLYVLAALAQSIADGARTWTDSIAIQDEHKSLPSGELQDQPVGTLLPVRTYAEKMISISDNTAADHLLFAVGRAAVEAMVTATGHHALAENAPFLATRELFLLKLMLSSAEQDAYVAASVDARRALLLDYDATRDPRSAAGPWTTPRRIDTLEWFATPADLCQVMAKLESFGEATSTAPVRDVLALNPGLSDLPGDFSYVAFKGGSEPGVLNLTWLVQRGSDGGYRFLSLGANDPDAEVDVDRLVYLAGAARALLAR
jgi:beta-lactamase class A